MTQLVLNKQIYKTNWVWDTLDDIPLLYEVRTTLEERGLDLAVSYSFDNIVNVGYALVADHPNYRKTLFLAFECLKRQQELPWLGVFDLGERGFYVLYLTSDFVIFPETDRLYASMNEASFILEHIVQDQSIKQTNGTLLDLEQILARPVCRVLKPKIRFININQSSWWTSFSFFIGVGVILGGIVLLGVFGFFSSKVHRTQMIHQIIHPLGNPVPDVVSPAVVLPPVVVQPWMPVLRLYEICQQARRNIRPWVRGWKAVQVNCIVQEQAVHVDIVYKIASVNALPLYNDDRMLCSGSGQVGAQSASGAGDCVSDVIQTRIIPTVTYRSALKGTVVELFSALYWHHITDIKLSSSSSGTDLNGIRLETQYPQLLALPILAPIMNHIGANRAEVMIGSSADLNVDSSTELNWNFYIKTKEH